MCDSACRVLLNSIIKLLDCINLVCYNTHTSCRMAIKDALPRMQHGVTHIHLFPLPQCMILSAESIFSFFPFHLQMMVFGILTCAKILAES